MNDRSTTHDPIPDDKLDNLRNRVHGAVLCPGDAGYDDARSIWNGMHDRHPAVIVRCRGTADVVAAVDFAREARLPLSVKGGGHNVAGRAVCDDGLTIDLTLMNEVRIDPDARRARVGAGALWRDLDREAQAVGLACTGGVVSSTGVAGLTLGGGIGYLTRSFGMACDNLLAADVVTAQGQMVHASETEHADLLWALRGGGGNFGVATSLEFRLHEVGPMVAAATVFHPVSAVDDALRFYRGFAASAPDELACYALIVNAPPDLPPEHQGKPVLALVACYSGDAQQGKALLAPIGEYGEPLLAAVDEMPYTVLQTLFDAGNPSGGRYYWKSLLLADLSDELLRIIGDFARRLQGAYTIIGIEPLGGAQARVAPSATAFPYRDVPFTLGIWTGWTDPADDDGNIRWTREFFEAVQRFGVGVYVNYLSEDDGGRIGEAYGDNLARLVEVKQSWDPENLFRQNQNITPVRRTD